MSTTVQGETTRPRFIEGLRTYLPLIGGMIIVLAATYMLGHLQSTDDIVPFHQRMNTFMGCFFVVFAVPKLLNLAGFVDAFKKYDIVSQKFPIYARIYPFVELALGVVLLSRVLEGSMMAERLLNVLIAIIAALTLAGVINSLRQKQQLDCACMGAKLKFPLSKVAAVENGAMLLMALSMITVGHSGHMVMAVAGLRVLA